MSTPVLHEDGRRYVTYVRLKCYVNISRNGEEIYHQVRPERKKKAPEMIRDAEKKYDISKLEAKMLVFQDMSNTLTMRQRLKMLQETMKETSDG